MAQRSGRALGALAVVLSLAFVAAAGALFYTVATGGRLPFAADADVAEEVPAEKGLEPKAFSNYSWEELSEVAQLVRAAGSADAAAGVAAEYGAGVGATRELVLEDGTRCVLTVVGVAHDEGSGLTLMASVFGSSPVSSSGSNAGGWEASDVRAWLAGEGLALLPKELSEHIVSVPKLTNNTGVTGDVSAVTQTSDKLWLFSATEVCGTLSWFCDEYGSDPNYATGYVDFKPYDALLNAEGSQYEYFAGHGVTGESDPDHVLDLSWKGASCAWWYRTPYPYSFMGDDDNFYYQVMAGGYPGSVGRADEAAGLVVGFCL